MSKSNREKRAARARARRAAGSSGAPGDRVTPPSRDRAGPRPGSGPASGPGPSSSGRAERGGGEFGGGGFGSPFGGRSTDELVDVVVQLTYRGEGGRSLASVVDAIGRDLPGFRSAVAARLRRLVASQWANGWQPVELVRHVRRGCGQPAVRLVLAAIAADHAGRPLSTLDPRWTAQIATLDLPGPPDDGRGGTATGDRAWVRQWMASDDVTTDELVLAAAELLVRLMTMAAIEALIAPPGADADWRARVAGPADHGATGEGAEVDPVLEKVRALLAKAESTSFDAEAEAFTAKAQELIARHAIDAALLAVDDRDDGPSAIRVFIDDPYIDAKSLLLQVVAGAGRCRTVFLSSLGMSTVIGFASDLAAVEMMFTSLLVQAQSALAAAARSAPPGARTRSRGYRAAFLQSYASRIGQRLDEINQAVVAESEREPTSSILPVLASRDAVVQGTVDELFGALSSHTVRGGYDPAGWASGRFAADTAQLGGGPVEAGGDPVALP